MLFNSLSFFLFLPVVFALYWGVNRWTNNWRGLRLQNALLLVASYVFYGWWDWRFLLLIVASTVVDWGVGLAIKASRRDDRSATASGYGILQPAVWLSISLLFNLGLLCYFKYANFFIESWVEAWRALGVEMSGYTLQLILPVGISFYTFQTLSYSIDVYRGKLEPTRSLLNFAAFVGFFPQLVAGPIERATSLLPQIEERRVFDFSEAVAGFRLILWGLFKKAVVADSCAYYVDDIFNHYHEYSGSTLILGAVYFSIQIYGDFSGYSDMAIGTARLFGIRLMKNFDTPYFSRDIAEFWRRWHISLSTWFRDYLYIPLGGSRRGKSIALRNTVLIFLVSGFWHGANWTFVVWGLIHAVLFIPLLLRGKNRTFLASDRLHGRHIGGMLLTFCLVTLAWVVFRSESVSDAGQYLFGMLRDCRFESLELLSKRVMLWVGILLCVDFLIRTQPKWTRVVTQYYPSIALDIAMVLLIAFGMTEPSDFIYFQF